MNKNLEFNSIKLISNIIYILNNIPNDSPHHIIFPFIKDVISNIGKISDDTKPKFN